MKQGNIMEVFTSFQGEGPYAGVRQLFVRLGICHMRCVYCDTPDSWVASKTCRVETRPHSKDARTLDDPISAEQVVRLADEALASGLSYHSISITGGEPLVQVDFLEEVLPPLRQRLPIYLETSGTLSDRLARVERWVDVFALDIKPPSTPGVKANWSDIERCVRIARGRGFVKIVVMAESPTDDEVLRAAEIIHREDPGMPLVLMPVTPVNERSRPPDGARLANLRLLCQGLTVYVIPQIHKLVGWQ